MMDRRAGSTLTIKSLLNMSLQLFPYWIPFFRRFISSLGDALSVRSAVVKNEEIQHFTYRRLSCLAFSCIILPLCCLINVSCLALWCLFLHYLVVTYRILSFLVLPRLVSSFLVFSCGPLCEDASSSAWSRFNSETRFSSFKQRPGPRRKTKIIFKAGT